MTIISVSNLYFKQKENRGIIMIKNIFLRIFISLPLLIVAINAQDGVDAIEKARQAKEAADKAAAEAAAATEAAIEAAATKAAKEARADAKQKKQDEEARKLAEAQAAEEAELDAAARAAADEAKRKMAAELGLELAPDEVTVTDDETTTLAQAEDVVAKEDSGWNIGAAASVGVLSGETFTDVPTGGTVVITTPFGFKLGPFDYTVSFGFGGYSGNYEPDVGAKVTFDPAFIGLGGNLTLANLVFVEGHLGNVGEGTGLRGFAGVTLEKLLKGSFSLPVNLLVGSEIFYSSDMSGAGNSSGWASLGIRLDYSL